MSDTGSPCPELLVHHAGASGCAGSRRCTSSARALASCWAMMRPAAAWSATAARQRCHSCNRARTRSPTYSAVRATFLPRTSLSLPGTASSELWWGRRRHFVERQTCKFAGPQALQPSCH